MQFRINLNQPAPAIEGIEQAIRTLDPSGVADIDDGGQTLRVSAAVDSAELLVLMARAGYPVTPAQLEQVPSECCGGCGG